MKTFSSGLFVSKFLLWIITHVLFVVFTQPSWGHGDAEKEVVRGLCQAQCVSLEYYLQREGEFKCLGPPGVSVIPYSTAWRVDCDDEGGGGGVMDCVGTCSLIDFKDKGYIPAKPEVSVFLDMRSKNITLEWHPDTNASPSTVYVISMSEPWNTPILWQQIAIVRGGSFTLGPVDDTCIHLSFRVAAVNRFGSRWFSNEIKLPGNIPGHPRNIQVKSMDYDEDTDEMLYTLKWSPPSGWDLEDVARVHNVTSTIQCSTDNWEKVYSLVDHFMEHKSQQDKDEGGYFTMDGRVSLDAIGCTVIFQISARSRCNRRLIGPAQEFRLPIKCSDVMQYKGEYCKNPPVLRPGPVSQLKLTMIPLMHGMMGLVSWQPPNDIGSAGKVEAYHVFYGIVNLETSRLIKKFEGSPKHRMVSGDTFSVDIFLNITTLESYQTVGVMVRAAGPGQIIESAFGKIIYADNMDSLLHTKAGHLISDDETVIVIASSDHQIDDRDSGMGVEIFWRRPNEESEMDIVQYALEWGRLHSNDTNTKTDDVFQSSTVSVITTNGV